MVYELTDLSVSTEMNFMAPAKHWLFNMDSV